MDGITAQMHILAAYETDYGIYNHTLKQRRPYALIAMHPKEDYLSGGLRERYSKDFRRAKVKDHYGLNILEFFELEKWYADFLIEDCTEAEKEETRRTNRALNALENRSKQ